MSGTDEPWSAVMGTWEHWHDGKALGPLIPMKRNCNASRIFQIITCFVTTLS